MSDNAKNLKNRGYQSEHMLRAIELSRQNLSTLHGGPFGAVIVKDGKIIAEGQNQVLLTHDPTAHAEVEAIRKASQRLHSFDLSGCQIYTSCEPCPMCLAAIYWSRLSVIFYGNSRKDAAAISFDDDLIYNEIALKPEHRQIPGHQCCADEAQKVFQEWHKMPNKMHY